MACAVAMVLNWRNQGDVALVHPGEGTTSVGQVHEAMNMAAVVKLPVIFICNSNGYAFSTPFEKQFAIKNLSARGPAYGLHGGPYHSQSNEMWFVHTPGLKNDLALITYGAMVWTALEAAQELREDGISLEVVDLRALLPYDKEAVLASVRIGSLIHWIVDSLAGGSTQALRNSDELRPKMQRANESMAQ